MSSPTTPNDQLESLDDTAAVSPTALDEADSSAKLGVAGRLGDNIPVAKSLADAIDAGDDNALDLYTFIRLSRLDSRMTAIEGDFNDLPDLKFLEKRLAAVERELLYVRDAATHGLWVSEGGRWVRRQCPRGAVITPSEEPAALIILLVIIHKKKSIPAYIYGQTVRRRLHKFNAMHPRDETFENPPYILFYEAFTHSKIPPPVPVIHECVVTLPQETFFVCGWYDARAPVNPALRRLFPHFQWRGEIAAVSLGTVVAFRKQAKAARNVDRAALQ
ncbi:hypothetical protein DENSPDRAFT_885087 [Dentipellis sp. KUC8613]|nr:hypothetical protein DENSPDRAFT_885087 [Dentipellis sp. KUC8613]